MTVDVSKDDGVGEGEERSEGEVEVWRDVDRGRWRDVDIGDVELLSGNGDSDDENFRDAVVDWRGDVDVGDGVMDEGDETPAPSNSVLSDGGEAREAREARIRSQLRLLYACHEDIFTKQKVPELGCRIAKAIAIP